MISIDLVSQIFLENGRNYFDGEDFCFGFDLVIYEYILRICHHMRCIFNFRSG
jgi:hypothetical protein